MEAVNLCLERESVQEAANNQEGGWHTEGSLAELPGWNA